MRNCKFDPVTVTWQRWAAFGIKHKGGQRSPMEGQATGISEQQRADQASKYGKAQGTLDQFEGPVDKSPFYKSLLKAGTEGTASAYSSAKANTAARAKTAGFGYEQPVTQGAENEIGAEEAKAQSRVPGEALTAATAPALAASGQTAAMGTAEGGTGAQYFGDAASMENAYQEAEARRKSAMWGALGQAAGAAIPLCVAQGTMVSVDFSTTVSAHKLRMGDTVMGIHGNPLRVIEPISIADSPVLLIRTQSGFKLMCSPAHTMLRPGGGYVRAKDALHQEVLTSEGPSVVLEVLDQGVMKVVHLQLDGSHTYCTGGIWSEE